MSLPGTVTSSASNGRRKTGALQFYDVLGLRKSVNIEKGQLSAAKGSSSLLTVTEI